jgi:hypothetical protein
MQPQVESPSERAPSLLPYESRLEAARELASSSMQLPEVSLSAAVHFLGTFQALCNVLRRIVQ